jgi:hypothetical protein
MYYIRCIVLILVWCNVCIWAYISCTGAMQYVCKLCFLQGITSVVFVCDTVAVYLFCCRLKVKNLQS